MALQAAFVIGVYLAREYLCQEENFCSRENGKCLRLLVSKWFAVPLASVLIVMVALLIDDSYGWGKVMERIRSILTTLTQDNANDVIELGDMNQPNQQVAQPPIQDLTVFSQNSEKNTTLSNVEGSGDTGGNADRPCSILCLHALCCHLQSA